MIIRGRLTPPTVVLGNLLIVVFLVMFACPINADRVQSPSLESQYTTDVLKSNMKITFLTPQLPYPPHKGTAMRNWGLISNLAERHEVAVLSFSPPPPAGRDRGAGDDPLTRVCRVEIIEPPVRSLRTRLRDMLATPKPDMALRLASDAYAQRLADWLARETFDVVHVEGIEMAPYLDVIEAAQSRPLIIFDDHNCEYLLQKRAFLTDLRIPSRWLGAAYSFVQWQRLLDYEAQACRRADRVLAVSEADAEGLHKLVPDVRIIVVPNGIDTRAYRPKISNRSTPCCGSPRRCCRVYRGRCRTCASSLLGSDLTGGWTCCGTIRL
jgi:glycosyltransferase involved in cell wall biosynthesis